MWCGSSPMARVAFSWCGRLRLRPTRTGSNSIAISTWMICTSTKSRRCAVLHDPCLLQFGTVLARSRPSRAGWRGGRKRPVLTRPARGAPTRARSGRRNGALIEQRNGVLMPGHPTVTALVKSDVTIANRRWRMPAPRIGIAPTTAAERQARHRAKLRQHSPTTPPAALRRTPPRPRRWATAVAALIDLQDEYRAWLDTLPANLEGSRLAEKLLAIAELDLEELHMIDPPRGYGRDWHGRFSTDTTQTTMTKLLNLTHAT